mmetsp:Transcript_24245/g.72751  ORF Transcript_24245/g.72751 Transcript_24245/m.72751 type:complete len:259 (+) Transcript_24245:207-983(+)
MSFKGEGRMGGVRGGANQFKWDDIKKMERGRDDYLGACMKASVNGRRDKDRDFFWYNKTTDTLGRGMTQTPEEAKMRRRLEILERRQADAAALADALGETAESRKRADEIDLEASELRTLLERGGTERDRLLATERVAGLGAAPAQRHASVQQSARVRGELDRQEKEERTRKLLAADAARRQLLPEAEAAALAAAPVNTDGDFVGGSGKRPREGADLAFLDKASKKAAKKERKAEKKAAKKAKKKAKKAAKKSSSDSD